MIGGLAGLICGLLSGMGIGGGTLLMVWMTAVEGMSQEGAQGINLLYFLPTAAVSLYFHRKNRLLQPRVILPAAILGSLTAALTAWLVRDMDTDLLRKLFGGFLIPVGIRELCYRDKKAK
ncbi:MAG: sulfite exporter TauE/SafE family protein [Oscillospiraceae bacterium]|nr:sulfite exporter TauE/SafE family protein [Oscillospiraceae bacterium]